MYELRRYTVGVYVRILLSATVRHWQPREEPLIQRVFVNNNSGKALFQRGHATESKFMAIRLCFREGMPQKVYSWLFVNEFCNSITHENLCFREGILQQTSRFIYCNNSTCSLSQFDLLFFIMRCSSLNTASNFVNHKLNFLKFNISPIIWNYNDSWYLN